MLPDPRHDIGAIALDVAIAHELASGRRVVAVPEWGQTLDADHLVRGTAASAGRNAPARWSCDLVSDDGRGQQLRFIEVKGRSTSGPVKLVERQRQTASALDDHFWIYAIRNVRALVSAAGVAQLWAIQNPMGPHVPTNAWRIPGGPSEILSCGDMTEYQLESEVIDKLATHASDVETIGPRPSGLFRLLDEPVTMPKYIGEIRDGLGNRLWTRVR
jgi:Domain of unknown function (DUF3883)